MIEPCPTCLGYVFSEIQATVEYYRKTVGLCRWICVLTYNYAWKSIQEVFSLKFIGRKQKYEQIIFLHEIFEKFQRNLNIFYKL